LLLSGATQFIVGVAERVVLIHALRKPDVCGILDAQSFPGAVRVVVIVCA
jgi:hypothetical protein